MQRPTYVDADIAERMSRILVATTNPGKLREIRRILARHPVELLSLADFPPVPEPEETGATFEENARLKALYYDEALAAAARAIRPDRHVAEDSGLVIDALNGEPGVQSARFLRPDASYPERFAEIYRRLAARPRRADRALRGCGRHGARIDRHLTRRRQPSKGKSHGSRAAIAGSGTTRSSTTRPTGQRWPK